MAALYLSHLYLAPLLGVT